jgi:hypothetical protein
LRHLLVPPEPKGLTLGREQVGSEAPTWALQALDKQNGNRANFLKSLRSLQKSTTPLPPSFRPLFAPPSAQKQKLPELRSGRQVQPEASPRPYGPRSELRSSPYGLMANFLAPTGQTDLRSARAYGPRSCSASLSTSFALAPQNFESRKPD